MCYNLSMDEVEGKIPKSSQDFTDNKSVISLVTKKEKNFKIVPEQLSELSKLLFRSISLTSCRV